jgi:hypothetical protein
MERNPYLMLGIPFGSSRDEAQVAFARRARPLRRRGDDGRDALTELTWALNQIDDAIIDPSVALDVYRIPADIEAFEGDGEGMFAPPPEPLARQQGSSEVALDELMGSAALELVVTVLRSVAASSSFPAY